MVYAGLHMDYRILFVTYRFGESLVGGAEKASFELMKKLSERGNRIDVLTTRSLEFTNTSEGFLSWDNQFTPIPEKFEGIRVFRYRVKNPSRRIARKYSSVLAEMRDIEAKSDLFMKYLLEAMPVGDCVVFDGFHPMEIHNGQCFRWTERNARLIARDSGISGIRMSLYCPHPQRVVLAVNKCFQAVAGIFKGRFEEFEMRFREQEGISLLLSCDRMFCPKGDCRHLGVAVKDLEFFVGGKWRELNTFNSFREYLLEKDDLEIGKMMQKVALSRHNKYSKMQTYITGPSCSELGKAAQEKAPSSNVIIAQMVPMKTLLYALEASKKTKVPLLTIPLFHINDTNHYWKHFFEVFEQSDAVLTKSKSSEVFFENLGYNSRFIGDGIYPEEFENDDISGDRFRERYSLEGKKLMLFVARKTIYKRYDLAIRSLEHIHKRYPETRLVMIGPDEDKVPVTSESVIYLGKVNRKELLDAYDACDLFILPSEAEAFGLVFCEAWLRKKPVLGSAHCTPVTDLIEDGRDGFLCSSPEEYAQRAVMLFDNPILAKKLGETGYRKTMEQYTWDAVADRVEKVIGEILL